jgi:hypothetical protein
MVFTAVHARAYVHSQDEHNEICEVCSKGGNLLCCDFCTLVYHLKCAGLKVIPEGKWACPACEAEGAGKASVTGSRKLLKATAKRVSPLAVQTGSVAASVARLLPSAATATLTCTRCGRGKIKGTDGMRGHLRRHCASTNSDEWRSAYDAALRLARVANAWCAVCDTRASSGAAAESTSSCSAGAAFTPAVLACSSCPLVYHASCLVDDIRRAGAASPAAGAPAPVLANGSSGFSSHGGGAAALAFGAGSSGQPLDGGALPGVLLEGSRAPQAPGDLAAWRCPVCSAVGAPSSAPPQAAAGAAAAHEGQAEQGATDGAAPAAAPPPLPQKFKAHRAGATGGAGAGGGGGAAAASAAGAASAGAGAAEKGGWAMGKRPPRTEADEQAVLRQRALRNMREAFRRRNHAAGGGGARTPLSLQGSGELLGQPYDGASGAEGGGTPRLSSGNSRPIPIPRYPYGIMYVRHGGGWASLLS